MSKQIEELTKAFRDTISTVTTTVDDTVKLAEKTKGEVESSFTIPDELRSQVDAQRSWFHQTRRSYPWEIILGTAFGVAVLSSPCKSTDL